MISFYIWSLFDKNDKQIPVERFKITESNHENGLDFILEVTEEIEVSRVYVDFQFLSHISHWRYLDYSWKKVNGISFVSNSHSPKLLKLASGIKVVAKNNQGCWEFLPKENVLRWHFYNPMLTPTIVYNDKNERVFLESQKINRGVQVSTGLIWGGGRVEEWARTPIGFVPTVCFTDHCDFDTLENLQYQRRFFKDLGIRITKGFFLFDYTHKAENASYENRNSREEFLAWEKDAHELAYHAFSQSFRRGTSEKEFSEFESPEEILPVDTYIDHGFHAYNYTKQILGNWDSWYAHMANKGIRRIWTYLDSGEANYFNVNQINPLNFTWRKMRESSQKVRKNGVYRKKITDFRNFLMYCVSESVLREGKYFRGGFSALRSKPSFSNFLKFSKSGLSFFTALAKPKNIRELIIKSNEIFHVNKFGPLFFKSPNQDNTIIQSFQTLAVRDYDIAFSEEALDQLATENGVMIAHTYFAYTGDNHEGRLFQNEKWNPRPEAKKGFERLGKMIQEKKLWNPTLKEMHSFYEHFDRMEYILNGEDLKLKKFDGISREIE